VQPWETTVKQVRRHARPWKAIIALALAITASIFAWQARDQVDLRHMAGTSEAAWRLAWYGCAVAFFVFGLAAVVGLAAKARDIVDHRASTSHAVIVRYVLLLVGGFTMLGLALELFGVPIGQLILGGALTSVFLGIAAQQSLSNIFAGLVLLFARPFQVGDAIRLRSGALGGVVEGTVADIGITYVRLDCGGSITAIPNSQVLNAVVAPVPPKESSEGE
jgi:small-conductance mechanosensitive channel